MKRPGILITVVIICAAQSAAWAVVPDEAAAIRIGQKVCRDAAGPSFFVKETLTGWRAILTGDSWKVSWGPFSALQASMEVSVSKADGKPTKCSITVS